MRNVLKVLKTINNWLKVKEWYHIGKINTD